MKNTLAAIAVLLAGIMNLPYLTEEILKIQPSYIIAQSVAEEPQLGMELIRDWRYQSETEPVIGLELKEYNAPVEEYVPSPYQPRYQQQCTPCTPHYSPEYYYYRKCQPVKNTVRYIRCRRPVRRLLGCIGLRGRRCCVR